MTPARGKSAAAARAPRARTVGARPNPRARAGASVAGRGGAVEFHSATPDRWDDVARLFGPRGACAGCWCMWPRLRGGEFRRNMGEPNRRAFQRIVRAGEEPGLLAYVGGEPVGWLALAPRSTYPRLEHSRILKPIDDQPVWSVVCFFVAKEQRRQGMSVRLLEAAARHARDRGAVMIEGYPVEPRSGKTADAFAWTGLAATFRAAGFVEVARPSPTRPIMRRALGRGARAASPATRRARPTASAVRNARARAGSTARKRAKA